VKTFTRKHGRTIRRTHRVLMEDGKWLLPPGEIEKCFPPLPTVADLLADAETVYTRALALPAKTTEDATDAPDGAILKGDPLRPFASEMRAYAIQLRRALNASDPDADAIAEAAMRLGYAWACLKVNWDDLVDVGHVRQTRAEGAKARAAWLADWLASRGLTVADITVTGRSRERTENRRKVLEDFKQRFGEAATVDAFNNARERVAKAQI
jgi:hypothetical protein